MELLITGIAGVSILVGAFATRIMKDAEKMEHISMAAALGALVALLLFDLFPEIRELIEIQGIGYSLGMVVVGIVMLKVLDLFIPDHNDTEENHDHENAAHIGIISSMAVILHNIVEGMSVYSIALTSVSAGISFAIGIAMHNIPMGMLIDSTLEERKKSERYVLLATVTLSTLFGGILMQSISEYLTEVLTLTLVAIASGMILFIVLTELLPHVFRTKYHISVSIASVVAGFVLVCISTFAA
jgi:zinc transporter, ZIP family